MANRHDPRDWYHLDPEHFDILDWTIRMGMPSLAQFGWLGIRSESTVERRLDDLSDAGLVAHLEVGRLMRPRSHYFGTGAGIRASGIQIPSHATQSGLARHLERLPVSESLLTIAPQLFLDEPGPKWLDDSIRAPLAMRLWHWLPGSGLVDAVGEYERLVRVGFSLIGPSLRLENIGDKWDRRFPQGTVDTYVHANARRPHDPPQPPDFGPRLLPSLSAYVFVTTYRWGIELLDRFFQQDNFQGRAFASWLMEPGRHPVLVRQEGRVFNTNDEVWQRPHRGPVRRPENLAEPPPRGPRVKRGEGGRFALLNGVSRMRVIHLLIDWDALLRQDMIDLLAMSSEVLDPILKDFVNAGVAFVVDGHHYLGRVGANLATNIDGCSPSLLTRRVRSYWAENQWKHKHEGKHNRAVLDLLHQAHRDRLEVSPGWRSIRHFPGNRQIRPDMVTKLDTPDLTLRGPAREWTWEVELTAQSESQVKARLERRGDLRWSLNPDGRSPGWGCQVPTAWLLQSREAEVLFQKHGQQLGLLMMTTTLEEAKEGPLIGRDSIWRYEGDPVALVNRVSLAPDFQDVSGDEGAPQGGGINA